MPSLRTEHLRIVEISSDSSVSLGPIANNCLKRDFWDYGMGRIRKNLIAGLWLTGRNTGEPARVRRFVVVSISINNTKIDNPRTRSGVCLLQLTDPGTGPGINAIRCLSSPNAGARLQHLPTSLLSNKNCLDQDF